MGRLETGEEVRAQAERRLMRRALSATWALCVLTYWAWTATSDDVSHSGSW